MNARKEIRDEIKTDSIPYKLEHKWKNSFNERYKSMKKRKLLLWILCAFACLMKAGPANGLTVTLVDNDPCTIMASLIDDDGDQVSIPAAGHGGALSKPYISTEFPVPVRYAHPRRAVAEFSLKPMRDISTEPDAVVSARLRFYFDDVIFPDDSAAPWTTQDFTIEAYTDTANGSIDGIDANDADPAIAAEGIDDWQGAVVQSWRFQAGDVGGFTPGNRIVGMFGPDEPFPAKFGDDELAIYGMIGFEVDVTDVLRAAVADPNLSYIGFRWISNTEGGHWTSMDPEGYLPNLSVDMEAEEPLTFRLQSTDAGEVSGNHAGRPYHIFNSPDDEAIYLAAGEWQGGHFPDAEVTWPIADGIIDWDVFTDPNRSSDRPEAVTYDANGNILYVYWDPEKEDYALFADENAVPEGMEKVYYCEEISNSALNIGNNGIPSGGYTDRQHVLISEFNLMRPGRYGLDSDHLISAHIELTIDRVIDMSLSGNNMALLPSLMYVNAYNADGILNLFENAQVDFERVNHESAEVTVWLTIDGTADGDPITDFSLSWYKLVDPGLGDEFTIIIDVTDAVRRMLQDGAAFAGFVSSCSADGEFCLASVDLVDTINDMTYLPTLVLRTNIQ